MTTQKQHQDRRTRLRRRLRGAIAERMRELVQEHDRYGGDPLRQSLARHELVAAAAEDVLQVLEQFQEIWEVESDE